MEKVTGQLKEPETQIPQLESLLGKKFERESELQGLKTDLTRLEREIAQNIKAKQEAQKEGERQAPDAPATAIKEFTSPGKGKVADMHLTGKTSLNEETVAQTIAYGKLMAAGLNEKVRKTKGIRI